MVTDIQNNYNIENDDNMQYIFERVYNNIDQIMQEYDHVLNPNHNTATARFINEGHEIKEAYAMSMTSLLLLYQQIINT